MSARTTTIETISNELANLAVYTDAEIENTGVHVLRSVLRNLGVHSIERNTTPVPLRASRKDELVKAVQTLAKRQRELAQAVVPTEDSFCAEVALPTAEETYDQLKRLTNASLAEVEKTTAKLANALVMAQTLAYPDTPEQKRFNVRCNVRARFFRKLRELEMFDSEAKEGYSLVYERFYKQTMAFGENDSLLKRKQYEQRISEKIANDEKLPIYLDELISWAEAKLIKCQTGLPKTEWTSVAIALALVTGRRCNEIMCTLTSYQVQDNGLLFVSGLSKGKDNELPELADVSTLVDPELVLAGIEWLKNKGKCIVPDDSETDVSARDRVNKRYSKELGQAFKSLLIDRKVAPELTKAHTFHALRKFYIMECTRDLTDTRKQGIEAARLLGHKNYATADSYTTEFTLVDEPTW